MKLRIRTLMREWYGQTMLFHRDTLGPVVEFDECDVASVEACTMHWCRDEDLTAYLYRRGDLPTLTVRYLDLKAVSPSLASKAKESHHYKIHAPDPCHGSPS